jgi:Protein of unknown function (DUF5131)
MTCRPTPARTYALNDIDWAWTLRLGLGADMADNSAIEWTEATWNPVTGCEEVSPGCAHCYAETFAERWRGIPGHPYEQGFELKLWPERLEQPLKWSDSGRIQHDDTKRVVQAGAIARPRIPSQAPRSFGRWQRALRSERHLSGGSQSSMRRLAAGGRPGISSLARRCRSG